MFNVKMIISLIVAVIIVANGLSVFSEQGRGIASSAEFITPYGTVYSTKLK